MNRQAEPPAITPGPIPGGEAVSETLPRAVELIRSASSIAVAAHAGPDGDAIGSTLACSQLLRELGKKVVAYNRDGAPYNFTYLSGSEDVVTSPAELPDDLDLFIVLDCSSLVRVDPDLTLASDVKLLCIDHHATIDDDFADVFVHDVSACAVGEMIYRLVRALDASLSRPVAEALYAAIHTDTGSFRYSNTSPAALAAAGELVRAGVDVWHVASNTYENHPLSRVKLLGEVLKTLHVSDCGRFAFISVTDDMYERTGAGPEMLDGFINHARGIRGVEVAAQVRQNGDDSYRVSLRSRGRVNVAALAKRFGGGGHHNAAGCSIEGHLETVMETLTRVFQESLESV